MPRSSNALFGMKAPHFHVANKIDKLELIGFNELFKRVAILTGVTLSPQAIHGLNNLQRDFVFVLPDITKLDVQV